MEELLNEKIKAVASLMLEAEDKQEMAELISIMRLLDSTRFCLAEQEKAIKKFKLR